MVLAAVERPRRERDADALGGVLNKAMSTAHLLVPGLYDVLVGPLMSRFGTARTPEPETEGNVFTAVPELEA